MRTIHRAVVAFTLGVLLPSGSTVLEEAGPARVVLPLERYEQLRPAAKKPETSLTVVNAMRLRGTFAGGKLELTLDGRALGERPELTFLSEVLAGFVLFMG